MVDETVDTSLFTDAAEAKAAEDIFSSGKEYKQKHQPVGTFQVEITEAVLERSQSSNRLQIHYELVVLVGPSKDIVLSKYDGLEQEVSANIALQDLARVGVKTTNLNLKTLPAALVALKGRKATVTAKQNGDFYNVNFRKLLTGPQGAPSTEATATKGAPGKKF